eukprot:CAMPEP_0178919702 /NCGR_PEP_ID=MMETSP0786-20121207/14590_1 /TAXON_ID=186022 /ORGANISM="Thalassionema frauenfeldii, Strain CCMP 1798" /LENGTH=126 /DNA_ID=CAMNT_0020593675 /DNA_START=290 /DNA_END=670 /DNA_ORIENTATION=+
MFASRAATVKTICRKAFQTRYMGGGPKPEWQGFDKKVRAVFPEDWQLAGAILSGYISLYFVSKLAFGGKKKEEPVKAVAASSDVAATTGGVPGVNTPEFEKYVESGAFEKMMNNEEQLLAWVAENK